jgi:hypothetical protein
VDKTWVAESLSPHGWMQAKDGAVALRLLLVAVTQNVRWLKPGAEPVNASGSFAI